MQGQIFVFIDFIKLYRSRCGDNLALVSLEFRQARLYVRRYGEDQMLGRHLSIPVIRVGSIADQ
ncbi:hypothetical protein D3C75_1256320 [compost metagenome]